MPKEKKEVGSLFGKPGVGRRTGLNLLEGKNIRKLSNGMDNFDDYWSESSSGEDSMAAFASSKTPTPKLIAIQRETPLWSMSPFSTGSRNSSAAVGTCDTAAPGIAVQPPLDEPSIADQPPPSHDSYKKPGDATNLHVPKQGAQSTSAISLNQAGDETGTITRNATAVSRIDGETPAQNFKTKKRLTYSNSSDRMSVDSTPSQLASEPSNSLMKPPISAPRRSARSAAKSKQANESAGPKSSVRRKSLKQADAVECLNKSVPQGSKAKISPARTSKRISAQQETEKNEEKSSPINATSAGEESDVSASFEQEDPTETSSNQSNDAADIDQDEDPDSQMDETNESDSQLHQSLAVIDNQVASTKSDMSRQKKADDEIEKVHGTDKNVIDDYEGSDDGDDEHGILQNDAGKGDPRENEQKTQLMKNRADKSDFQENKNLKSHINETETSEGEADENSNIDQLSHGSKPDSDFQEIKDLKSHINESEASEGEVDESSNIDHLSDGNKPDKDDLVDNVEPGNQESVHKNNRTVVKETTHRAHITNVAQESDGDNMSGFITINVLRSSKPQPSAPVSTADFGNQIDLDSENDSDADDFDVVTDQHAFSRKRQQSSSKDSPVKPAQTNDHSINKRQTGRKRKSELLPRASRKEPLKPHRTAGNQGSVDKQSIKDRKQSLLPKPSRTVKSYVVMTSESEDEEDVKEKRLKDNKRKKNVKKKYQKKKASDENEESNVHRPVEKPLDGDNESLTHRKSPLSQSNKKGNAQLKEKDDSPQNDVGKKRNENGRRSRQVSENIELEEVAPEDVSTEPTDENVSMTDNGVKNKRREKRQDYEAESKPNRKVQSRKKQPSQPSEEKAESELGDVDKSRKRKSALATEETTDSTSDSKIQTRKRHTSAQSTEQITDAKPDKRQSKKRNESAQSSRETVNKSKSSTFSKESERKPSRSHSEGEIDKTPAKAKNRRTSLEEIATPSRTLKVVLDRLDQSIGNFPAVAIDSLVCNEEEVNDKADTYSEEVHFSPSETDKKDLANKRTNRKKTLFSTKKTRGKKKKSENNLSRLQTVSAAENHPTHTSFAEEQSDSDVGDELSPPIQKKARRRKAKPITETPLTVERYVGGGKPRKSILRMNGTPCRSRASTHFADDLPHHSARKSIGQRGLPRYSTASPLHLNDITCSRTPKISPFVKAKRNTKIVRPASKPEGIRRSQRTKVKPLDWARNERIIYRYDESGLLEVAGIDSPPNDDVPSKEKKLKRLLKKKRNQTKAPKTPRRLSTHKEFTEDVNASKTTGISVLNPETQEEVIVDCVRSRDTLTFRGPHGGLPYEDDQFLMSKALVQRAFSSGKLILRPAGVKERQIVHRDTMLFYVIYGRLGVEIHNTTTIVESGDFFFIPQGNTYSIKNLRNEEAKLVFFQYKH